MNKTVLITGILLVLAFGAIIAFRFTSGGATLTWQDSDVRCLVNGHQNLSQHFHPSLSITVDGERERVPSNIGVSAACLAEAHTHDGSGTLHFESADAGRTFTLADFFAVWGQPIERPGFSLEARIKGTVVEDVASEPLSDGDRIELAYSAL